MTRHTGTTAALFIALSVLPAASASAAPPDWAAVPGKEVVLFYPGQAAWEWVLTAGDHSGATKFREGKNCFECHKGEEKTMGALLVSGKKVEPTPIGGKPGFVVATVKFANDADRLYAHLDFAEGTQPDAKMDAAFATKITMMLDDGKVPEAKRAGCWGTCHDDAAKMTSAGSAERTKYLGRSRAKLSRQGGGDDLKSADDLAKMMADGQFLEFWQARVNPGAKPVPHAFAVLEKRTEIANPAVTADANFANGSWSVTLSRKLVAGAPYKDLAPGKNYMVGFALHAGHTAQRFHYVSFEHSLVLDQGQADFVAVKK